ncbi:MAG: ankyrin repeat domain-containing protein [Saprospiraceae bacterium]|nr:ankyrin repeat domain-containing protein [Saprospiraceae bacterium]
MKQLAFTQTLFFVAVMALLSCQSEQKQTPTAVLTTNITASASAIEPQDSSCSEKLNWRAFRKDTTGVRNLLEEGCDPNGISLNGDIVLSPLRMASDPVTIKLLLDHGADPNQDFKDHLSPFHYAAIFLTPQILQMMWEKGANVNKVFSDDQNTFDTPLLCAIWGGKPENVKWLIEHGADVNYRTEDLSALTQAVSGGNASIVKMLLEKGVDVNAKFTLDHEDCYFCPISITPIFYLSREPKPDKKIIDLLIKHGANINYVCEGAYTVLDEVNDVETANYLLQKGATIETKNTSALASAAVKYNVDMVKFYLKKGANPNQKGSFNYTA